MTTYVGFRPRKWQKAVIDEVWPASRGKGKTVVVKSRRQAGKSFMSENLLLCYALNKKRSVSALVSVTLAQSRKVFRELVDAIEPTGVIKKKNEQTLELQLITDSQILFKSSEQGTNSLRGYTINGILILDEASFLSEDILQAVLPWTNVHRPPIVVVSTPKFRNCFFYRFFQFGKQGKEGYVSIDWNDYDLSEFLSEEQLEQYRSVLPSQQFKCEYLGEFADDDAMVFNGFRDCLRKDKGDRFYRELFVGIDWGTGKDGDSTSISVINEQGQQLFEWNFNNLRTSKQIDRIESLLRPLLPYIVSVYTEDNSIGTPLTDLLEERMPELPITRCTTTNKSKNDIITLLQVAFEKGEIELLNDDRQNSELASYSLEYNPRTKTVTYNAPAGQHDDTVMALAYSWKAYKDGASSSYILG